MPRFVVEVSAQLENIGVVTVPPNYPWHINLLCGNCGERSEKPVVLMQEETVEGVRGATVNLKKTCKLCGRACDVKILEDQLTYSEEQSPNWAPFLLLECRGTEPSGIMLADDTPLIIVGIANYMFEDTFLENGEFFGWDERRGVEASVTEFRTRIVKA